MEGEPEFYPKELYRVIKNRIWLIIIITLTTTIITAVVSILLVSPTYESKVGIIIGRQNTENVTNEDVALYQILFQTYQDIAGTYNVAQIAADKLGNGTKVQDLLNRTTVTAKAGTMILNIKVVSKTAADAYKDVQVYSEAFVERAKQLKLPGGDIQVIENAQLPESPIKPNANKNVSKAFFFSFLISVGISFLLEYNKPSAKKDMKRAMKSK